MKNPFQQRSSTASSFLTGLVGWMGFIFPGSLIFGFKVPSETLFLLALGSALLQITFLKVFFFRLRMQIHVIVGVLCGLSSAVGIYFLSLTFCPPIREHPVHWLLIYGFTGAAVGGFLSYFYSDDKKIMNETVGKPAQADFGRDAHWMEPFLFGALSYLLVFFPFQHFDLTINIFITGSISGLVSAGASHFSPDRWKRSYPALACIIIVAGGAQGWLSGWLFRTYADQLYAGYRDLGMTAGILTYTLTFARGRQLAYMESEGKK